MLADSRIRWETDNHDGPRLVVHPYPKDVQFQPASLDLCLGNEFKTFDAPGWGTLDPTAPIPEDWMETTVVQQVEGAESFYELAPNTFTLATTVERIEMPRHLVARVEGKSSLGRLGLIVHATAGFIDPGFKGQITLEMVNLAPRPILLRVGMRICQLSFDRLEGTVLRPYGHPDLKSKYQGQMGTTMSRPDGKGK